MELFESHTSDRKLKLHTVDDNTIILSAGKRTEVTVLGVCLVKVICGSFDILGYRLTSNDPILKVCSTKENSLKIISTAGSPESGRFNEDYLDTLNLSKTVVQVVLNNFSKTDRLVVLTVDEECMHFMKYIEHYTELPLFLSKAVNARSILHTVAESRVCNEFNVNEEWEHIVDLVKHKSSRKVILAGGKGVGKSSFLRYLINKSLSVHSKILVLDLDPGQPEFTAMGCVSAVLVEEPLLGVNFAHLAMPLKSFYIGCVSVTEKLTVYQDSVKEIINFCNSDTTFRDIPWFINTMGFASGVGVTLLKDFINYIKPTNVVQINSRKESNNFPRSLTSEYVLNNSSYQLHTIASVSENSSLRSDPVTWGLNAHKKRSIVVLSYFFPSMKSNSINILDCIPYRLSFKKLKIIVTSNNLDMDIGEMHKLCCINGNMVALCFREKGKEVMEFKGLGIVRGIDYESEDLFLITPLSEMELSAVNIIHMNVVIQPPVTLYKKQSTHVPGVVPFMAEIRPSYLNQEIKKTTSRYKPYMLEKKN